MDATDLLERLVRSLGDTLAGAVRLIFGGKKGEKGFFLLLFFLGGLRPVLSSLFCLLQRDSGVSAVPKAVAWLWGGLGTFGDAGVLAQGSVRPRCSPPHPQIPVPPARPLPKKDGPRRGGTPIKPSPNCSLPGARCGIGT